MQYLYVFISITFPQKITGLIFDFQAGLYF